MKDGHYLLSFPAEDKTASVPVKVETTGPGRQVMLGPSIQRDTNAIPSHWQVTPLVTMTQERIQALRDIFEPTKDFTEGEKIIRAMIDEATP